MNEYVAIENIQVVLNKERLLPTIMKWNRLECRPRTRNFDRALQAEVRDALWMLTKQWQMGDQSLRPWANSRPLDGRAGRLDAAREILGCGETIGRGSHGKAAIIHSVMPGRRIRR
jgi:hypothetical protein